MESISDSIIVESRGNGDTIDLTGPLAETLANSGLGSGSIATT